MTDGMTERKIAARRAAFARRKAAKAAAPEAVEQAAARFLAEVPFEEGEIVSGYRPIRTELDPTPLMLSLHERGLRLCVPVIAAESQPLAFREWTPTCAMIVGAFDAEVPEIGDWLEPTLLIAPLVGFDRAGWRLGYGGGFYDRTLHKLRALRPTRAIGYAYAAQELEAAPRDPTDQPLDAVVTERETIFPAR